MIVQLNKQKISAVFVALVGGLVLTVWCFQAVNRPFVAQAQEISTNDQPFVLHASSPFHLDDPKPPITGTTPEELAPVAVWFSSDQDFTAVVAWGDVDNDGDLDLAAGGGTGSNLKPVKLYMNENGTLSNAPIWTSPILASTRAMAWGDMDSDGDLDLAVGNGEPVPFTGLPNHIYENISGTLVLTWTSPTNDVTFGIAWGDIDGDGDLDLVEANFQGPNRLYLNNDDGFPLAWSSAETTDQNSSLALGDVNGDGDLDLAVGSRNTATKLYPNTGGTFTTAYSFGDNDIANSVAWGDADGDGDLDLAVGNGNFIPPNNMQGRPNKIYENIQGELTGDIIWESPEADVTYSVAWGDADGDGDLDLATGNWVDPSRVYSNTNSTFTLTWSTDIGDRTRSVAWGDMDGDGDLDLAVGNANGPNKVYGNEGSTLQHLFNWQSTLNNYQSYMVAWGDMDGDGDLDLAAEGGNNEPVVFLNQAGRLQQMPIWSANNLIGDVRGLAWGDVDGDGDLDLAAGYLDSPNRIYENNGTILAETAVWEATLTEKTQSVAWGDVDGDGDLDLAVGNGHPGDANTPPIAQPNRVYLNENGLLQTLPAWTSDEIDITMSVAWGDVDGDGDLDLAVGNVNAPNRIYLNVGGMLQTTAVWSASSSNFTRAIAWGDVDGDGGIDLAAVNDSNQNAIFLNQNGMLLTSPSWLSADSDRSNGLAWGDFDGDGDLDLAVANGSSNIEQKTRIYINHNGSLETTASWQSRNFNTAYSIAWGDVDNDGDLDLAVGNLGRSVRIYYNQKPATPLHMGQPAGINLGFTSEPVATFSHTVTTLAPANFYATPGIHQDGRIPITYTLTDPLNRPVRLIEASYSLNGGDNWVSAQPVTDIITQNLSTASTLRYNADESATIPDSTLVSSLSVTISQPIEDIDVWFTINHPRTSDLDISLISPDGTPIILLTDLPDADGGFYETVLDDQAAAAIGSGSGQFNGRFRPQQPLFNLDTQTSNGLWQLVITDDTPGGSTGTLSNWGIYFNSASPTEYKNSTPSPIPDASTLESTLLLSNTKPIIDVNIWLNITHPNLADLDIQLVSPAGTTVDLLSDAGGNGDNFVNLLLSDQVTKPVALGTAPFTGIFRPAEPLANLDGESPQGEWTLRITDDTASNSGTLNEWGIQLKTAESGTHVYHWDVFNSNFFGQSDNVVFRLVAHPSQTSERFAAPGPFQLPYVASQTFPFRVRGSQIQVFSGTITTTNVLSGALVYRLPNGTTTGAQPIANSNGQPYHTDEQGYLQGRGALNLNDHLVALWPVTPTTAITFTDQFTLYYTSAAPTPTGLDITAVQGGGIQELLVSSNNKLLLLNLDISLEWDARQDTDYLDQLEANIERTSQIFYDLTNGQVAIGSVRIYQAKENWLTSDIAIYASNTQRPNANLGGIVTSPMSLTITPTGVISSAILPGQIRMGPIWNRFGDPNGTQNEDWSRALAHELGHYALFLLDNYLGISDGIITHIDCQGSAMTDAYREDYSEFLARHAYSGDGYSWLYIENGEDENECLQSLAEQTTGKADWETIGTFYPFLSNHFTETVSGPSSLPLAVTQVSFVEPSTPNNTLPDMWFYLANAAGQTLPLPSGAAQGYVFKTQGTPTLTDDTIIPIGTSNGPIILARGIAAGDKFCVYHAAHTPVQLGCLENITALSSTIRLYDLPGWRPEITVTPVNSSTLVITVTQANITGDLMIQIYPAYGPPGITFTSPVTVLLPTSVGNTFTQTMQFPFTVFNGFVRVWEAGSEPERETITRFFLTPGWNGNNFIGWGGNNFIGWGGNNFIGWGSNVNSWNAPVSTPDGQVTLFNVTQILGTNTPSTLQTLAVPVAYPPWLTLIGQMYRFEPYEPLAVSLNIQFQYLGREVPEIYENKLCIYYSPDGGETWERLDGTVIQEDRNLATAVMPGPGIYALMATIQMPPLTGQIWNEFTYPDVNPRPVAEALASISGTYTSIYHWNAATNPPWTLYDQTISPTFSSLVNDLETLQPYYIYSIYMLTDTTPYIGIPTDTIRMGNNSPETPPATFYGWITNTSTLTIGMPITATINGVGCGAGTITTLTNTHGVPHLAYKVQVKADSGDGCGRAGQTVVFETVDFTFAETFTFDTAEQWNRQAWRHDLDRIVIPIDGLTAINDGPTALGSETLFTATINSGNFVSFTWDFGDSSQLETGQFVTHEYTTSGIYTAVVTAFNSIDTIVTLTTVEVEETITGLHVSYSEPLNPGTIVTFAATIITGDNETYLWDFGDGTSVIQNGSVVTHTYILPIVYTVVITATNQVSSEVVILEVSLQPSRFNVFLPVAIRP